jgi:hypothetical protein
VPFAVAGRAFDDRVAIRDSRLIRRACGALTAIAAES